IALQTACSLLLLGSAALLARPTSGFMRRLSGSDSGSLLIRRLLPWAFLLPVTLTGIRLLGERAGLYDQEFGRALLSFTFMLAFTALIWWTGSIVSRQERAAEAARSEIQERLVQSVGTMTDGFIACDASTQGSYLTMAAARITR